MERTQLLHITLATLLCACGNNNHYSVINDGPVASDSTILKENGVIIIPIGSVITPIPNCSSIINDNGEEEYAIMDENKIYIFPLEEDLSQEHPSPDIINLDRFNNLNNYSGFTYVSQDTILVYNYNDSELSIFNPQNDNTVSFRIEDPNKTVFPKAITPFHIIASPPYIILSGCRFGHPDDTYGNKHHTSAVIDTSNGEISFEGKYPDSYSKGNFGGVYMNDIYQTMDNEGRVVMSFPASHYLYRWDPLSEKMDSVFMGSRYSQSIESSEENALDLLIGKDTRIRYYISQHSYSNIIHDPYRNLYYRIARHPLPDWNGGTFRQPFSIITMKVDGEIISETPIFEDYENMNLWNVHVSKKGLLIQKLTDDENSITFKIFTPVL